MKTDKENKTGINKNINNANISNDAVTSADDHLGGNPLTIKETLIWLEESKIFFYNIQQSLKSEKSNKTKK